MSTLTVELDLDDDVTFVLGEIAKKIEEGYKRGIGFPVDWTLEVDE